MSAAAASVERLRGRHARDGGRGSTAPLPARSRASRIWRPCAPTAARGAPGLSARRRRRSVGLASAAVPRSAPTCSATVATRCTRFRASTSTTSSIVRERRAVCRRRAGTARPKCASPFNLERRRPEPFVFAIERALLSTYGARPSWPPVYTRWRRDAGTCASRGRPWRTWRGRSRRPRGLDAAGHDAHVPALGLRAQRADRAVLLAERRERVVLVEPHRVGVRDLVDVLVGAVRRLHLLHDTASGDCGHSSRSAGSRTPSRSCRCSSCAACRRRPGRRSSSR